MRADAALHKTEILPQPPGKRGHKPKHGPRLPTPREADRSQSKRWRWKTVAVYAYGEQRLFQVSSFQAVWPQVFGMWGTRPTWKRVRCGLWKRTPAAR